MDSNDYTPSAITRLMAPALMLALAALFLADHQPTDTSSSKPSATTPVDAAELRAPAEPPQAGKAGSAQSQHASTGDANRP